MSLHSRSRSAPAFGRPFAAPLNRAERRWVRTPGRPIRYGVGARVADGWHALRDAGAGLPAMDSPQTTTPTVEALSRLFEDRAQREYLQVQMDLARLQEHETQLASSAAELELNLAQAEKRLALMPERPPAAELAERRGGEADSAPEVVRLRRLRQYREHRATLVQVLDVLRERRQQVRMELDTERRAIRIRTEAGATQARRLLAHTLRRIAFYERRLVRRHPDGIHVLGKLALARPELPAWAILPPEGAADVPDVETASRPASVARPHRTRPHAFPEAESSHAPPPAA